MVLSSLSRPLARSIGPIASRSRGLHSIASGSAASSLRATTSRVGAVSPRQAGTNSLVSSTCRSKLGPTTSIRSLTDGPREKVKVLMVLYSGGKHAEEVSLYFYLSSLFTTNSILLPPPPTHMSYLSPPPPLPASPANGVSTELPDLAQTAGQWSRSTSSNAHL